MSEEDKWATKYNPSGRNIRCVLSCAKVRLRNHPRLSLGNRRPLTYRQTGRSGKVDA